MQTAYLNLLAIKDSLPGADIIDHETIHKYNETLHCLYDRTGENILRFLISLDDVKPLPRLDPSAEQRYLCTRSLFLERLNVALEFCESHASK